jgi:hypothetical protein
MPATRGHGRQSSLVLSGVYDARVVISADSALFQGACEGTTRERRPGYATDAKVLGKIEDHCACHKAAKFFYLERGHHLTLFFAVNEVVVVLH